MSGGSLCEKGYVLLDSTPPELLNGDMSQLIARRQVDGLSAFVLKAFK